MYNRNETNFPNEASQTLYMFEKVLSKINTLGLNFFARCAATNPPRD